MTTITRNLARESSAYMRSVGKLRPIIVELDPSRPTLIGFRLKGTRKTYYLTIDGAYRAAVRGAIAAAKDEREVLRKQRAKERGR